MTTATAPGLKPRTAKSSDDYVSEILARRKANKGQGLTVEAKRAKLGKVLTDRTDGIRRVGVGMVGPIQLKLRYQGITRNVLVEDPVTPGSTHEYDIIDDTGQAYLMSGTDGEVRITPFEGKRARVDFFRIASFPMVRKEDLYQLKVSVVEQAQDETRQAIEKAEDSRLVQILAAALADYAANPKHTITPNHTVLEASGYYTPQSLYTAVSMTDMHELPSARLLVNTQDYRDFYRWDLNQTGWAFKNDVVAGMEIQHFGEFQIQRSVILPQGTMYLTPEPKYLGVFPLLYSLQVEENPNVEAFWKGWVFDEMVSMAILNPRGIAAITKS